MKTSELVKELMNHLLTYGDREVITAQKDEDADYTYGDGTIGIVGEREKRCVHEDCSYYKICRGVTTNCRIKK